MNVCRQALQDLTARQTDDAEKINRELKEHHDAIKHGAQEHGVPGCSHR